MRHRVWILIIVAVAGLGLGWWWLWPGARSVTDGVRQAVLSEPDLRFAVVGDHHGDNPVFRQIISDVREQPYDFLLDLADTSEHGLVEEWQGVKALEAALPYPVYHTVGSHDIQADPTRTTFVATFGHDRWYTVDHGQVHLIVLDNADRKIGFPAEELDWLERDLAAHPDTVNLIAYHRPFDLPLAQLLGDDETAASRLTNDRFVQIITQARVDYIFTAHLHTYLPYTVAGVPAVVSGGGGDPAQIILGGATNNNFHYLEVTVKDGVVTVTPKPVALRS